MSAAHLEVALLVDHRERLTPHNARTFISHRFRLAEAAQALRIRLTFQPARSGAYKNLLTISLFGPEGFRGAGHRHAPQQEILVGRRGATPGFIPGPLPPGEWLVELDCHCVLDSPIGGVEYALTVEAIHVEGAEDAWQVPIAEYLAAGKATVSAPVEGSSGAPGAIPEYRRAAGQTSPPAPLPGGEGSVETPPTRASTDDARWLKGDLHFHSQHSDARWSMNDIVRHVEQNQLDFICLTDHNTNSAYPDVRWAMEKAGLNVVVIPGMELTTFWGHANALGVAEWIDWRVSGPEGLPVTIGDGPGAVPAPKMPAAAERVHRLGGTFVVNHPRSAGYPACTGCRWELGDQSADYADAIEVWNGPWDRSQNHQALAVWDRWLNAGHRIPATAGTDSHEWSRHPQEQGFTYVWAQPDAASILAAVRGGQSFISSGPRLTWSHAGADRGGAAVVEIAGLRERAELRLVQNTETTRGPQIKGDGRVRLELTSARGWYRAELWRHRSSMLLALINPIWLA